MGTDRAVAQGGDRTAGLNDDIGATALEFVAHNEFGVAFEYLISVLVENDAELTEPARSALARAASPMSLEDNSDWRILSA